MHGLQQKRKFLPGKNRRVGESLKGGPHSSGQNHRGGPPSDLHISLAAAK